MSYPSSTVYPSSTSYPSGTGGGSTASGGYPGSNFYPGNTTYPSGTGQTPGGPDFPPSEGRITWGQITERQIETGLDRGVLYPKDVPAVAWNGLLSVDEEGGEGAAEYYVDGRPFLYLPKPKEFKATLSAYTYPNEFSAIMGELEVADGMYLDSQMGDVFDLSYRTRIVDSLQGTSGAYKIHLIYNATVVPSARNYGTIGNSISPTEFSWTIQAVPVRVAGYRPTAHITIDTRNMDQTRLTELENILYGDYVVPARMPDPQFIFDLLSFGDAIIITDNGDGTWTAEGSYQNIYMIGDEIFQIDNINAIDNGNGTYTISSTP